MPQVMSKQAHMIKNFFASWDSNSAEFQQLFSREREIYDRNRYVQWIDPIIYGRYVSDRPGEPRSYFSLGKSPLQNCWRKDDAFFSTATELQKNNWQNAINQLSLMIPSRFYNAPQDANSMTFMEQGLVGIWSQHEALIGRHGI